MDTDSVRLQILCAEDLVEDVAYLLRGTPAAEAAAGDALACEARALVVPLNAFGFFDSGFALRVTDTLGMGLQDVLQTRIREQHFGELLVGQAEILPTGRDRPAYVIAAPLSRCDTAGLKDRVDVYLAMRGAMLAVQRAPELHIDTIAVPLDAFIGGGITPYAATRQIRYGIRAVLRDAPRRAQNLSKAIRRERELKRAQRAAED